MAFGISGTNVKTGQQNRTTNYSTEVAYMTDKNGKKIAAHTHGAEGEISEEFYVTPSEPFSNTAVGGQEGTAVVTGVNKTEVNNDYCKYTVTRKILPDNAAYEQPLTPSSGN